MPSEGPEVFHGYLPEVYVAIDRPLGWLALNKGRHTLSFIFVGKDSRSSGYNFGLNDVVLERIPEPRHLHRNPIFADNILRREYGIVRVAGTPPISTVASPACSRSGPRYWRR